MKFCDFCQNYCQTIISGNATDAKLEYQCNVCKKKMECKTQDGLFYQNKGNKRQDYNINSNIKYDCTLPRIIKKCPKCNEEKEHVISQINPESLKSCIICTGCC